MTETKNKLLLEKICPDNWDEAKIIEDLLNEEKECIEAQWSWDCNFKLDFDGGMVNVSSRFYPPHKHTNGNVIQGTVSFYFNEGGLDRVEFGEKEFSCSSLGQLKKEVEEYVKEYSEKIKQALSILIKK